MQCQEKKLLTKENISLQRQPKHRRSLQMPVLTLHDIKKKKSQLIQPTVEYEKNQQSRKANLKIIQRVSLSETKILQSIIARKQFETNKDAQLQLSSQSYNRKRTSQNPANPTDKNQSRYHVDQHNQNFMMKKLNKNRAKIQIKSNLSLVMQKIVNNATQLPLSAIPEINHMRLSRSITWRQISEKNSKLLLRNKFKRNFQNRIRTKLGNKSTQRSNMSYKNHGRRSKSLIQQQDVYGWQTNQKNKESQELNYCSIQSFMN